VNRATYGLCCLLLVACSDSSVEPETDGLQGDPLRGGPPVALDAVPPPAGTRQCRSLNPYARLGFFDPQLYKMPISGPVEACLTKYFATPHHYHYGRDDPTYYVDPVTLTFSQPVYSLVIDADGNYPCNSTDLGHTTAYNAAGTLVYSGAFVIETPEQQCGADLNYGRLVDTVRSTSPIKSVTITAASPIAWELPPPWFPMQGYLLMVYNVIAYESPCPPLAEQVLNDPAVRAGLLQALAASRPTPDGVNRREHGGYVYLRDDGTPFLTEEMQSGFSECKSNLLGPLLVPQIAGAHFAGYWHTHPNKENEPVYSASCKGKVANSSQTALAGPREKNGGGSEDDWGWANQYGQPMYVINLGEHVFRLDPGTATGEQKNNPNKWKFDAQHSCLSQL
jgi:hypothetical protein